MVIGDKIMRNVLFIHQSADMYGSDKVLLSLVAGLDRNQFIPIVMLPCDGPLLDALRQIGIRCHIVPMVRVGRATLSLKGLIQLPASAWRSIRAIDMAVSSMQIHLVHSNTLAVLSGAIWATLKKVPHVWHVHEIIERPWFVRKMYAWLLRLFATKVICNSHATLNLLLQDQPFLERKAVVVWNGIERLHPIEQDKAFAFRNSIGLTDSVVLVVLLGRINRWKGHVLLVEAAELLEKRGIVNLHYAMVGSPPDGQEHFLYSLKTRIDRSVVREKISVLDFTPDIWAVWNASDIAVVPSTEPEPFGMVAIEAMTAGKPVIAANHGGLAEIVVNGETGLLFKPNSAEDLAAAIESLANDKYLRIAMGAKGAFRAENQFSITAYVSGISSVYADAAR